MIEEFGVLPSGERVLRHTLKNGKGLRARVLTYGCVVQTLEVPGRDGEPANIVLGCATLDGYRERSRFFGAVVGRYGNRIGGARFTLDGTVHELPANQGTVSLHGGLAGFDKKVWEVTAATSSSITLEYTSPDGEEGYPGTLQTRVTYTVTEDDALQVDYHATTDAPTVVNLTNHSYFNLAGEDAPDVYDHVLHLPAASYLPVDAALIPEGGPAPVEGTPFDFRTPRTLGSRIREPHPQILRCCGYDHCYVLDGAPIRVEHPASGRIMEVTTTEPGVQLYTANFLDGRIPGTSGRTYRQGAGLCLETQHFPDSPNRPDFPSTVLRPGAEHRSTTVYRFTTAAARTDA
ncbi:aldose epimerase family protein [Actinocorallia longicatena]|uniref:Aldose 1-epimerase n=1 Tax=Actinocorallia longicatena TaxID=111803 RepID=A0ABP6QHH9_9ACTN